MTPDVARPAIQLRHEPTAPAALIAAFRLGCEEEGVPLEIGVGVGAAEWLARAAAADSNLFIGAGIDAGGAVALHEHRLGDRPPLLARPAAAPADARRLGVAAGRLARRRPLPDVVARDNYS